MAANAPCQCRKCKWTGHVDDLIASGRPGGLRCPKCDEHDISVVTPPAPASAQ